MVLPIADDNSDRRIIPGVNYALLAANIVVFVLFQGLGRNDQFTYTFATVPERIATGDNRPIPGRVVVDRDTGERVPLPALPATPVSPYVTLFTSMFMHGSLMHLAGNMLFLWIFGDNVEDALGHVRYLLFYLFGGLFSSMAHVFTMVLLYGVNSLEARTPSLGASGAISAVLGGYLVLFPYRRVTVILFRFLTQVPAYVAIGMWFVLQLVESLGLLGGGSGGVAYAAHIGGFLLGAAIIKPFTLGRECGDRPWARYDAPRSYRPDDYERGPWR